jgi:hypothetical protein
VNIQKWKALEAAGWRFGDAADFLGMTDEERQLLETRVEAPLAIRSKYQSSPLAARTKIDSRELAS